MALFYKPVQSPKATKEGDKLWHPMLVKVGRPVNTQTMAEEIAEKSAQTAGDVQSVVRNLMSVMRGHLLNSKTVRLEGLGTFTVKIRSTGKGVLKAEDVNPRQINRIRIMFTPEYFRPVGVGTTRAMMQGLKFEHADLIGKGASEDNGGEGGEGDDPEIS